jgi:hypothetical protein
MWLELDEIVTDGFAKQMKINFAYFSNSITFAKILLMHLFQ